MNLSQAVEVLNRHRRRDFDGWTVEGLGGGRSFAKAAAYRESLLEFEALAVAERYAAQEAAPAEQPRRPLSESFEEIREASGAAWDHIDDPAAFLGRAPEPESAWISVEERLPEREHDVIALWSSGAVRRVWHDGERWLSNVEGHLVDPAFWMPYRPPEAFDPDPPATMEDAGWTPSPAVPPTPGDYTAHVAWPDGSWSVEDAAWDGGNWTIAGDNPGWKVDHWRPKRQP